jgi:hypothetical protein
VTDSDSEHRDDITAWQPESARRLRERAEELAAAVRAHAEAVTRAASEDDLTEVFAANDALLPVVLAYADAQCDYAGNGFPFAVLEEYADTDPEDDDTGDVVGEDFEVEEPAITGVSVLQRRDYELDDEQALIDAGRAAYQRIHPDVDDAGAETHVSTVGNALYAIAHADGWSSLDDVEALEPTGGAVVVVRNDGLLRGDPDDWPDDLFDVAGEALFEQDDVFES